MPGLLAILIAAAATNPPQITFTQDKASASRRSLADKLADIVSVKDAPFNAKGDGVTDDTAAVQAAINAVKHGGTASEKNLYFPSGTYNYSTQLLANQLRSLTIYGDGNRNTVLHYTGGAGGTAFKCLNCYRAVFRGIRFDVGASSPTNLVSVIEDNTQGDYDGTAPSQFDVFEECSFVTAGAVGLLFDFVTNDVMNDSHRVVDGLFSGATTANVSISGQNAMGIIFERPYSINSPRFIQVQAAGGSFKVFGGYVNSTTSNFDFLSYNTDGYTIVGTRSESSPRFLSYTGGSATPGPVYMAGVTYSAASLNADTFAINSNGMGPFTIIGSSWGIAGEAVAPRFSIANSSSNPVAVVLQGNSFGANSADTVPPLIDTTGNRVCAQGNRFKVGATSVWVTKPEECFRSNERAVTLTYTSGVAIAVDASTASFFKLVVNDTVAVVINAPSNITAISPTSLQRVTFQIKATAAMNAANPFGGAGWKAGTVPIPTNGNNYIYEFLCDGVSCFQVGTPNLDAN